jgi:putative tRNA adenosine deaminase-associated protein
MIAEAEDSVAVVVYREGGAWQSGVLPERTTIDLENGAIALVNVADEFFVALRAQGGEVRIMLSDATAAVAWDLAKQVVDHLGLEAPVDDAATEIWPAGDIAIFADLGLDEMELGALVGDLDAYADEMLLSVADRLGFAEVYDRALETAPH